jgi:signal transduction histidine kinase
VLTRSGLGAVSLSAAAALAAEWMRLPGWILAVGLLIAAGTSVVAAPGSATETRSRRVVAWAGAVTALLLAVLALSATRRLKQVERHPRAVREALVTGASRRLGGELDEAVQLARTLVDRAAQSAGRPAPEQFAALGALVRRGGPSHGVMLFDARGQPRAWAGIQRTALRPDGPDLSTVTTPFYLWLVARRQLPGGVAVSAVLLARADDVPRAGVALTDRFAQRTGVGLRFLDPGAAPRDSDVFDYVRPGVGGAAAGGDTLFAVQPVPPGPAAVAERLLEDARRRAAVLILLMLTMAALLGSRERLPFGLVPAAAAGAMIVRAPLRETFGPDTIFSPATYSQPLLGPFSASAGSLLLAGVVLFILACALWHRGLKPSVAGRVLAVGGTLLAPYLLQRLARGITPPSAGVAPALWVAWQVALMVAASALVLLAAALVRGRDVPAHGGFRPWLASAIALAAAALGLWLWSPNGAWPEWYPYVWAPALLLALWPMPFRGTLATIAVVAGSSAALLTWGATTEGRMALAARDLEGLGDQSDPAVIRLLDRVVHEERSDSAPRNAGDLFVVWRRSALGAEDHPAALAVWGPAGERQLTLDLANLDVPADFVQSVAREASQQGVSLVRPVLRVPGLHGVAAMPLSGGRVLTITIGPRSRLVAPSRVARFLFGGGLDPEPPFDVALAPPVRGDVLPDRVVWRRDGWQLHGERSIALPGGPRHAHAAIDLRGPSALLQRGLLLMVLDIAVLGVLWIAVELAIGRGWPVLRAWWPRARRSLRVRLSASLVLFFMVPTVALAAWSFGRLEEEFRGARELLLQRTLHDAAGVLAADTGVMIGSAARRVDAELVTMRDGALAASSAPVLADLGLADRLVPDAIYPRLAFGDEIELSAEQRAAPAPTLVGYRVTARGEGGGTAILGAPEFLGDPALQRREADLGITVLVAGVLGFLAALVLSGLAARALARPLQELRQAALAVGTGEPPAFTPGQLPAELETIGGALVQAAAQVEAGQRAQRVLAWGEMARQVAHEIKNPLTPIRLGVQHLLRVEQERPAELGAVLPQTGARILAEIDRLDAIARAFSRFAMPGAEGVAVEVVDVAAVVRDVVQLYRVGDSPVAWEADAAFGVPGMARRDELVEVLVNLCENARDAGAGRVVITARAAPGAAIVEVRDDGRGIAPEILPRVFEPKFSTTTSGSGLGLAIAKRLVESWGGTIAVVPAAGPGTTVRLELRSVA